MTASLPTPRPHSLRRLGLGIGLLIAALPAPRVWGEEASPLAPAEVAAPDIESPAAQPLPAAAAPAAPAEEERDPWWLCELRQPLITWTEEGDAAAPGDTETTHIFAREAQAEAGVGALFSGDVVLRRGERIVGGETARYDQPADTVDVSGDVRFSSPTFEAEGERAHLQLGAERGWISGVSFNLPEQHGRGTAERLEILDPMHAHLAEATFTTCDAGKEDWLIRADRIRLDRESNTGEAYNGSLWFKGVPLLYLPYLNFPLEGRKSGFLSPSYRASEQDGLDLFIPYYWNIAPNRDATTTLRYIENRGPMLLSEFRFLEPHGSGILQFDYLPEDDLAEGESRERGTFAYTGQPTPRLSTAVNYNYISDDEYFNDLSDSLDEVTATHLERRASVRYQGNLWSLEALALGYQSLTDDEPYQKLPQVRLATTSPSGPGPRYQFQGEWVRFAHETKEPVGVRTDLQSTVSFPYEGVAGFVLPRVSLRYTSYDLEGQAEELTRGIPTASLDSGLFFEREFALAGRSLVQTLEPRLFYLYVPYVDQNELPVFDDTDLYTFSFSQLFRENRFTGPDRVGDANQLTAALTTRFIDGESGVEYGSASIGQIFYFEDRRVQLDADTPPDTAARSDIMGELTANPLRQLNLKATLQWDPESNRTEQALYRFTYQPDARRSFSAAYVTRFEETALERQTDVALLWPISPRWRFIGRWFYDHLQERSVETLAGFEYESCCWSLRFLARDRPFERTDDITGETLTDTERSYIITLNLKGIGEIGQRLEDALEPGVLGFRRTNETVY